MSQDNIWKLYKLFVTSLMIASRNGSIEIVKLLLEKEGIDVLSQNKDGKSALIFSLTEKHPEIAKMLLSQKGIDVNAYDIFLFIFKFILY